MTVAGPTPVGRNDASAFFFDGTARRQFLLLRCPHGHWNRPQADRCAECGSGDLQPTPASGRARLLSWAVVHPRPRPDGTSEPPSVPGIVELEEGPWWWTRLVGAEPAALADGMAMQVDFETPAGSEAVPVFRPA